jgi:hypothetical protein
MRSRIAAVAVLLSLLALGADEPPAAPKSAAAIASIKKSDAAVKAAQDEYDKTVFKIKKTEDEELKAALKAATQKGDLDEANAINAIVKSIESEFGTTYRPHQVAPQMLGKWQTVSADNKQINWLITTTAVKHDGVELVGIPEVSGNIMLVKWPNGWVDRLTFEGEKFFEEACPPGHLNDRPAFVAEGLRDAGAPDPR